MSEHRSFDMDIALIVAIFLIPSTFQLPPPAVSLGTFSITVVEILIIVFYLKWVATTLIRRKTPRFRSVFDRPFLALLFFIFVHLVFDISRNGMIKALGDFRQYLPLFMYHPFMDSFRSARLARARTPLFVTLSVVALYIIFLFAAFRDALVGYAASHDMITLDERVFFDNTIFLLFMYQGYIIWKMFIEAGSKAGNWRWLALLLANVVMLAVMQVRTQWVIFVGIFVACGWGSLRKIFRSPVFVSGTFLSVLLVACLFLASSLFEIRTDSVDSITTSVSERFYSLVHLPSTLAGNGEQTKTDVETVSGRLATATVVVSEYIMPNLLFGVGLGGEIPMVNKLGTIVSMKYQIDNGFLTIIAKYGIPGFLLYFGIFVLLGRSLVQIIGSRLATETEKQLAKGFLAALLCMLVGSLFSSIFIREQPSLIAFLLMLAETEAILLRLKLSRSYSQNGQLSMTANHLDQTP